MASIFPRKGAKGTTYEARWNDQDGKEHTKRFKLRKEAAAFLATAGGQTYVPDRESPTIGKTLDQWLHVCEHVGRKGRMPVEINNTLPAYKTEAAHLKKLKIGTDGRSVEAIRLGKLTGPVMADIRDALLSAHPRPTARRCFARLKSALYEAMARGQIQTDPGKGLSITMSSRDKKKSIIPEPEEASAILASAYELSMHDDGRTRVAWSRYFMMIKTLFATGMRPSELRGLPRAAISTEEPMVTIFQRADKKGIIGAPKTPAGNRSIAIPDDVWEDLQAWLLLVPSEPDALVFANGKGNAESLSNIISRGWNPAVDAAKLARHFTPYSLRHFYASTEIAMGATAKELQEAMGHENIQITLDTYGHLFAASKSRQKERAQRRSLVLAGTIDDDTGTVVQFAKRA